jgi:hypothetical protein
VAQKPDGKPARTERVTFTRPAAERIAKVVRHVEQGDRGAEPLTFGRGGGSPYRLSVATFTGSWATGTWKTVTLINSTNTASVYNWCNVAEGGGHVVFGKASGTNSAVEITMAATATCRLTLGGVDLTTIAGYSSTDIQLLGHNTTGPCLEWYSVTTCSTSTAA